MTCLDDETVFALVLGKLSEGALPAIETHLAGCADCRTVVGETARFLTKSGEADTAPEGDPDAPKLLAAGTTVSRYVIVGPLGAGGAGVVYLAHDPQLRRKIALKLLPFGNTSDNARERWIREAQAMAQLSHPNVVHVHDAGVYQDNFFIAMELVDGQSVASWLADKKRPWREILDVFLKAGRGLAAAHAAGLIHRDFKPANALVGSDGRVCVADFGLARPVEENAPEPSAAGPLAGPDSSDLTEHGVVVGTPAYMAPEQFLGQAADARSDQFSFCVALFSALCGRRPFRADSSSASTIMQRPDQIEPGRTQGGGEANAAPVWVLAAIQRGLSMDPAKRFPSMEHLLAALTREKRDRWPLWLAAGIGAVALAAGFTAWRSQGAAAVCGNETAEPGEECDDGNRLDTDGCISTCRWARCGDGFQRRPIEECDGGEGCSAQCLACAGFLWPENTHCYSAHTDGPVPWSVAQASCTDQGGAHLVTYASNLEAAIVTSKLLKIVTVPTWIGFRTLGINQAMAWRQVTGEGSILTWWAQKAPAVEKDRCAVQVPSLIRKTKGAPLDQDVQGWIDEDCEQPHGYVCEKEPWSIRRRDNHAFKRFFEPMPWAAAAEVCRKLGSHLATVADADEQTFIGAQASVEMWIGASDSAVEGTFRWITGEPFQFQAFHAGEPDDPDGASDCIVVSADNTWHDRSCTRPYAFVCEVD